MNAIATILRALSKARFRILGLATIKDTPTERFNGLVKELVELGWHQVSEYDGVDAWIDYGCITLRRKGAKLKLEWDNWTEGASRAPACKSRKSRNSSAFQ